MHYQDLKSKWNLYFWWNRTYTTPSSPQCESNNSYVKLEFSIQFAFSQVAYYILHKGRDLNPKWYALNVDEKYSRILLHVKRTNFKLLFLRLQCEVNINLICLLAWFYCVEDKCRHNECGVECFITPMLMVHQTLLMSKMTQCVEDVASLWNVRVFELPM